MDKTTLNATELEEPKVGESGNTASGLAGEMRARADFYRFLSDTLLHEFSAEQVAKFRDIRIDDSLDDGISAGFARIRRYLTTAGADPRTDLACDYARVFLSAGVYEGLTAEPYESVFTSEDQIMMQDARDDAVRIYRENGVDVDPELRMPEDHLGLEFEFMAVMADKTEKALATRDISSESIQELLTTQCDFLEHHILNWIELLDEKVEEYAELPFYPAIMDVAESFVLDDKACLDALLIS